MMHEYLYPKPYRVDLDKLHADVVNSTMTNKNIAGCLWDEHDGLLRVYFYEPLSNEDKVILDNIVAQL